jgi:hypothetical protein
MGITCFLISILPGSEAAYWNAHYSSDNKIVYVTTTKETSTLTTTTNAVKKNGDYGYGTYGTLISAGTDDKGRNVFRRMIYFNGILKTGNSALTTSGYLAKTKISNSNNVITQTSSGNIYKTTFSAQSNYKTKTMGSQVLPYKANGVMKIWENSVYTSKTVYAASPIYKKIGSSYYLVKVSEQYTTYFTNGDTRNVLMSQIYQRNSAGKLIGKKSTGTSTGREKVNGKYVKYTGVINIKYRYDAKDIWNDKFTVSTYSEKKTSNSSKLVKRLPYIEFIIDV